MSKPKCHDCNTPMIAHGAPDAIKQDQLRESTWFQTQQDHELKVGLSSKQQLATQKMYLFVDES